MKNDFTFYADVDGLFVRPVGEEILSGLVAVRHPGLTGRPSTLLPYETNRQSTAYVPPKLRKQYCAGGFQGGRTDRWLQACREIDDRIRIDEKNGVRAFSHDESHWNCYLAYHQEPRSDCLDGAPLLLSQDYCAHEGAPYSDQNTARFISLKKNNAEFHAP